MGRWATDEARFDELVHEDWTGTWQADAGAGQLVAAEYSVTQPVRAVDLHHASGRSIRAPTHALDRIRHPCARWM